MPVKKGKLIFLDTEVNGVMVCTLTGHARDSGFHRLYSLNFFSLNIKIISDENWRDCMNEK